ncbi:hypothetical protein AKJ09_10521 [Labilithrix luteola]|uniref:Heavy metal binding domain-containing protein n=1 Tax=Labilithrix luteola TaxID=1391654 RepID=A0A0K1QDR0_9BACT|nr:heavy metal-binding domain-containing protein [Labilithrix luteola]AKV03858.1 hypothetical protein AKJ09_10521 [Labilithrix luteola]
MKLGRIARSRLLGMALPLAACSLGPAPVSASPHDPSNPHAAEGSTPAVSTVQARNEAHPHEHAHGGHSHDAHSHDTGGAELASAEGGRGETGTTGDAAVTYACPMHPEVTSSTPGVCPKCNMRLVPAK